VRLPQSRQRHRHQHRHGTPAEGQDDDRGDEPPQAEAAPRSAVIRHPRRSVETSTAPGQPQGITAARQSQKIGGLRVAAQDLHRQDDRKFHQTPAPTQANPAIDRVHPQRKPGRANQVDDVAVLEQDRRAERIRERTERRADPGRPPRTHQDQHGGERQCRMSHHVHPRPPRVRQDGENQLSGIKHRRGRVPQERYPSVLLRFPEWPPPLVPLLLNALMKRVIIMAGIAKTELAIAE